MTVRTGMASLIEQLRGMAQLGTADYSVAGITYWTDQQVQDKLDRYMMEHFDGAMQPEQQLDAGGTVRYYTYHLPAQNVEAATSGSAYWTIRDSTGSVVGTAEYSSDYIRGVVVFTADRGGTAYYWRGRSYNINKAAADLWREKMGSVAAYYSFSTDNQSFSRAQWFQHCQAMAAYYDKQAGFGIVQRVRVDLVQGGEEDW